MEGCSVHVMANTNGPENIVLAVSKANFQNNVTTSFCNVLPPIGVFWDIENCRVPKRKSACALVNSIRKRFFKDCREAEFLCVCDINKENRIVINELNDAQVTVVHIDATSKNAADEKLKQCMRRFVDTHKYRATLLLISDDINFATDLSDFRHRHHIHIILLHRGQAPDALVVCASEHYNFLEFVADLPYRTPSKAHENKPVDVLVSGLPVAVSPRALKIRLKRLSDNCGGKVMQVSKKEAILRFSNQDSAERAQRRMNNAFVFGQKIRVNFISGQSKEKSAISCSKESNGACEASSSSGHESSQSDSCENELTVKMEKKSFCFPPPPVLDEHNSPTILKTSKMSNFFQNKVLPHQDNCVNKDNVNCQDKNIPLRHMNNNIAQPTNPHVYVSREETSRQTNFQSKNVGKISPYMKDNSNTVWLPNEIKHVEPKSVIGRNINPHVESSLRNSTYLGYPSVSQGISLDISTLRIGRESPNYTISKSSLSNMQLDPQNAACRISPISCLELPSPVELYISNLDQSIDANEMKNILQSMFREYVWVIHISMLLQPDGNRKAVVKVPSIHDAQLAISQLQRKKIGHKRILISHATNDKGPPFFILKSEVVALLKDVPAKQLPLFKFRELYEKRYHRAISVSELYKMRDALSVHEDSTGRMVCLTTDFQITPSPSESESSQELAILEKPYCERHFHLPESQGWADQESTYPMPDVCMSLKSLAPAVHTLLDSHQGSLPLNSFCACYEADIGMLPIVHDAFDEDAPTGEGSVPLEHLVTCVAGVEITKSRLSVKKIQWCENKANAQGAALRCISPMLAGPLSQFGREVVDLLKSQPRCIVPFNKFIPIYHHHFGRQCRVADYGFTKLLDLLEALPHIIQVLGQGQNRMVTLTHRMQVRRFTADLLRILKSRASKQIIMSEFASAYEQCMEKSFDVTNYCICHVEDMLSEMPETAILVTTIDNEIIVSIPKRDQTSEEIERTKLFSSEVVELLKHTPTCSMGFNKFIPSYHHHLGKQCRVADYGFSKLIELFEAIPIIEIWGSGEEKVLHLVEKVRNKILSDRLVNVLKSTPNSMIALSALGSAYVDMYGYLLKPAEFDAIDLTDLLKKLHSSLKVIDGFAGSIVTLADDGYIRELASRVCRILMEQADGKMPIKEMNYAYQKRFGHSMDLLSFQTELVDFVKIESGVILLTPLRLLARDMLVLLYENNGQILFLDFESAFEKRFGVILQPLKYEMSSLNALIYFFSEYFTFKGRKHKRTIQVNRQLAGSPLPILLEEGVSSEFAKTIEKDTTSLDHDIINEPVPSCITRQTLTPVTNKDENLMGFHTPSIKNEDQSLHVDRQVPLKTEVDLANTPFASGPCNSAAPTSIGFISAFNSMPCSSRSANSVPYSTHPYHRASPLSPNPYMHQPAIPMISLACSQQTFPTKTSLSEQNSLESFHSVHHCFPDGPIQTKSVKNSASATIFENANMTVPESSANTGPLMLKSNRRGSRIAAQFSNPLYQQSH